MTCTKNCMSIDAIVDKQALPLSPPDSFKSRSPTLSPKSAYMVPPIIPEENESSMQYNHTNRERYTYHQDHHHSMSPEERRYRNKLASAKYRAKKQASMKFMTTKLSELMSTNSSLEQELAKVKQENAMLRAMYDKMMIKNNHQQFV